MKRGLLSDHFEGVVAKRLSVVETSPAKSNQHEFNGTMPLRRLLGDDDRKDITARFIRIDDTNDAVAADGTVSWYDARRQHPTRTEYRLYYPGNEVTGMMQPGDAFFLALRRDGSVLAIFTPEDGTVENQLVWMFGLDEDPQGGFVFSDIEADKSTEIGLAARYIFDELGIDAGEPEADILDTLIEPFGLVFPTTRVFSELARSSLPEVCALDDPDAALVGWMEREEALFRRLERRVVEARISAGFHGDGGADVDGFLSFSLSVQNRRKSRAGQALENHLEAVFTAHGIRHVRGAETENRNKPDFLFPGQAEYRDPKFDASRLTMLGSKSTLKDRWRQVLSEAIRIERKHLLTLEPGISEHQTNEMQTKQLQLVVPRSIQATYRQTQQEWLMDLADFMEVVRSRQILAMETG